MSLCINPRCRKRENPDHNHFCQSCGSELLLLGRYRVISILSKKGGFSDTYEVRENHTTKVLKVLTNDNPHAIELFEQEAQVLNQLKHPGIPQGEGSFIYHPRDSQTSLHCLVMEKIEGQDLEEYQKQNEFKPITQELALEWLSQLAYILHEVHRRKFFHRDIKPSNIILKPDGQLTLIDFGAVRQITRTIIAGGQSTGIYTPGYAPPEQEKGYAGPQSDFYALGGTFVYLLTGKEPNDAAIYDFHNNELKWRKYAPNIDPKLADFIDELIDDKPTQRPANTEIILKKVAQLKQDLLNTPLLPSPKTISQQPTITQPPPIPAPKPTPIIQSNYAGFWIRCKAAIIDNILVMVIAATLASLIVYQLEDTGKFYEWGLRDFNSVQELIIKSAVASGIGTTIFGFIFTLLGVVLLVFNPDYIINLLPSHLQFSIILNILELFRSNLLLLIPLIFGALIKWIYFTFSEGIFQATLGKMILGLRVNDLQNQPISLAKANRRYWAKLFSVLPIYSGFMLAGWTKKKRGLHDFIAGTTVVKKID